MRFTEHELTVAVTAAAKTVATARARRTRSDETDAGRTDADQRWNALDRHARYRAMDAVGSQILPALVALPDVEVAAGTRPAFTDAQIVAAVEETLGEGGGRIRRRMTIVARTALVRTALDALPVRVDPDGLT